MNLPAVILFICFSTAYGLTCKQGGERFNVKTGNKTKVVIQTKECPESKEGAPLCMREEVIYSGKADVSTTNYYCPSESTKPCIQDHDGKCFESTRKEGGFDLELSVCCSSDPEFKNMPSLFSKGKDPSPNESPTPSPSGSTPSSDASSPTLLASIIALLGLNF